MGQTENRSFQGSAGHMVESISVIIIENSDGLIIYLCNVFLYFVTSQNVVFPFCV